MVQENVIKIPGASVQSERFIMYLNLLDVFKGRWSLGFLIFLK